MEPVVQKFRSAVSGFNRRDVQQYIEASSAAHRKEVAELKAQLEAALRRQRELEASLSAMEGARGAAAAQEAKVRKHLESSAQAVSRLRGEQTENETKLAEAKQEMERLQTQVTKLAPLAMKYSQLKKRVATVELDAHRKAQSIVDKANGQAEEIRNDTNQKAQTIVDEATQQAEQIRNDTRRWLGDVMAQYDAIRQGLDALLRQAQVLNTVSERAAALEEEAGRLRERCGL